MHSDDEPEIEEEPEMDASNFLGYVMNIVKGEDIESSETKIREYREKMEKSGSTHEATTDHMVELFRSGLESTQESEEKADFDDNEYNFLFDAFRNWIENNNQNTLKALQEAFETMSSNNEEEEATLLDQHATLQDCVDHINKLRTDINKGQKNEAALIVYNYLHSQQFYDLTKLVNSIVHKYQADQLLEASDHFCNLFLPALVGQVMTKIGKEEPAENIQAFITQSITDFQQNKVSLDLFITNQAHLNEAIEKKTLELKKQHKRETDRLNQELHQKTEHAKRIETEKTAEKNLHKEQIANKDRDLQAKGLETTKIREELEAKQTEFGTEKQAMQRSHTANLQKKQEEIDEKKREISGLQEQISQLKAKEAEPKNEKHEIERLHAATLREKNQEIKNNEREISRLTEEKNQLQIKIESQERNLARLTELESENRSLRERVEALENDATQKITNHIRTSSLSEEMKSEDLQLFNHAENPRLAAPVANTEDFNKNNEEPKNIDPRLTQFSALSSFQQSQTIVAIMALCETYEKHLQEKGTASNQTKLPIVQAMKKPFEEKKGNGNTIEAMREFLKIYDRDKNKLEERRLIGNCFTQPLRNLFHKLGITLESVTIGRFYTVTGKKTIKEMDKQLNSFSSVRNTNRGNST